MRAQGSMVRRSARRFGALDLVRTNLLGIGSYGAREDRANNKVPMRHKRLTRYLFPLVFEVGAYLHA